MCGDVGLWLSYGGNRLRIKMHARPNLINRDSIETTIKSSSRRRVNRRRRRDEVQDGGYNGLLPRTTASTRISTPPCSTSSVTSTPADTASSRCLAGTGETIALLSLILSYSLSRPSSPLKLLHCTRTLSELRHLHDYLSSELGPSSSSFLALGLSSSKNLCINPRVLSAESRDSVDAGYRKLTALAEWDPSIPTCEFFEDLRACRFLGSPASWRLHSPGNSNFAGYSRHNKRSKLPSWILSHLRDAHLNLNTDMAVHIAREFLRKMAQPYDKAGSGGKKTLLWQDDLEKIDDEMLY